MSTPAEKFRFAIGKTARDYAIRYGVRLGRYGEGHGARAGYYFIHGNDFAISMRPTAASAITMMRKLGHRPR